MYEITVEGRFSAAHRHRLGAAEGEPIHGHDFLVLVRLAGADLVEDVLLDFHEVEVALGRHLALLHYKDLSQHPEFATGPATPAVIARWLYDRLAPELESPRFELSSIEVQDTDHTGATYTP